MNTPSKAGATHATIGGKAGTRKRSKYKAPQPTVKMRFVFIKIGLFQASGPPYSFIEYHADSGTFWHALTSQHKPNPKYDNRMTSGNDTPATSDPASPAQTIQPSRSYFVKFSRGA